MSIIYIPSSGPSSWQQFLAEPEKQWRTGYSARSLAYSWEEANGFPSEIRSALDSEAVPALNHAIPLIVIPEHKVPLPGGRTESQNDVFVLAATPTNLVSITIEGKVEEPFGEPVSKWNPDASPGKKSRFDYLVQLLALSGKDLSSIYYQLLHRTASAIIEAQRFHAPVAAMLVHSFSQSHSWFSEFSDFAALLGVRVEIDHIQSVGVRSGIDLHIGWIVGDGQYLER